VTGSPLLTTVQLGLAGVFLAAIAGKLLHPGEVESALRLTHIPGAAAKTIAATVFVCETTPPAEMPAANAHAGIAAATRPKGVVCC
jgi:hypothetical protein